MYTTISHDIRAEYTANGERFDFETMHDAMPCYCDSTVCQCTAGDIQTGIVQHVTTLIWCDCGAILPNHADGCTADLPF